VRTLRARLGATCSSGSLGSVSSSLVPGSVEVIQTRVQSTRERLMFEPTVQKRHGAHLTSASRVATGAARARPERRSSTISRLRRWRLCAFVAIYVSRRKSPSPVPMPPKLVPPSPWLDRPLRTQRQEVCDSSARSASAAQDAHALSFIWHQVSLSSFAFLFSELVQYHQSRVSSVTELERK
jgi:hypothetical protein